MNTVEAFVERCQTRCAVALIAEQHPTHKIADALMVLYWYPKDGGRDECRAALVARIERMRAQ